MSSFKNPLDVIERIIYSMRYLLVITYLIAGVMTVAYVYSIGHEATHSFMDMLKSDEDQDPIVGILSVIDGMMVASVVVLIIVGSYEVYVRPANRPEPVWLPIAFRNMTSSILKKMMAASLVGVSSVYILKIMIEDPHNIPWGIVVPHMALLTGFLIFWFTTHFTHEPTTNTTKETTPHA